jgi:hypothetical protein
MGVAIDTGGAVGHGDPNSVLTPNEQQFVNDLASIGVTSTAGDRAIVALGYYYYCCCGELSSGKTRQCVANRAYAEITGSTPQQAKAALDFAMCRRHVKTDPGAASEF